MADVVAIILAGGMGRRFGAGQPKQLQLLGGLPIIFHTLRRFDEVHEVDRIIVPAQKDWQEELETIASAALRKPFSVVPGGSERNLSILAAVRAAGDLGPDTKVLLHDGVRPLVTPDLITRVLRTLDVSDAVLPVIPTIDLLVRVREGQAVGFDGAGYRRGQTPLGFRLGLLSGALESVSEDRLTRAGSIHEIVLAHAPETVITTVEGEESNIKITMPADRWMAGQYLLQNDMR